MARRIDVELTSARDDGTWTWRAAGAKQPKGDLAGALLYDGAQVGDVVKAEAEFLLDGIEIIEVFAPKAKKARNDLLEMVTRELRDDELVTEVRAPKGRGGDRDRGKRRGGGDRDRNKGRGRKEGGRSDGGGDRKPRGDRNERRPRPDPVPERPKPKRLRPRRVHRDAVMAEIPVEHRPIADQVLQGGIPAVRAAIEKQNAEAKSQGTPEVPVATVLAIAEPLVGSLRTAEWHDRADAALADLELLDLRDLRSVVSASDASARDNETRALAEQLREGLSARIESDHNEWLEDLRTSLKVGRSVRALRLSSRPVKAGEALPPELSADLVDAANAGLSADATQERWATVIDAIAFSPIRSSVAPSGFPAEPTEELLEAVRRVADRVPHIAAHFGVDPAEAAKARKRRPRRKPKPKKAEGDAKGDAKSESNATPDKPKERRPVPGAEKKVEDAPAEDAAQADDVPTTEEPAAEATPAEEPAAEATPAEEPAAEATPAEEPQA